MKKMYWLLICILLSQYSFSQDIEGEDLLENIVRTMGGHLNVEVKVQSEVYRVDTIAIMCLVSNKDSPYEKMLTNIGPGKYMVTLEDRDVMKEVAKEAFCECLNTYEFDSFENIDVSICSDLSGKINSVSFIYRAALNIPIEAIAKFEREVKKRCRLRFDRNSPALSQANYVNYNYVIFVKEVCS